MAARTGIVAVGALLLGTLLGAAATRASYRGLQAELSEARAELEKAQKDPRQIAAPMIMGLQRFLDQDAKHEPPEPWKRPGPTPTAAPRVGEGPEAGLGPTQDELARQLREDGSDLETRQEALDFAAEAWRLRQTQVRARFLEVADLDDEQLDALDQIVGELNDNVASLVDDALDTWDFDRPPATRDAIDFAVSLGGVYQEMDDQLRQVLTEEQLALGQDVEFDIFTQIDPSVFVPLVAGVEPRAR